MDFPQPKTKLKYWLLAILGALLVGALIFMPAYPVVVLILWSILLVLAVFYVRPDIGLYILVFCLPITDWLFAAKNLSAALVEIIALLLLVAFGLRVISQGLWRKLRWPALVPFLLFLGVAILSVLSARYIWPASWYTLRWLVLFYLAYIFLPYNIISHGRTLKRALIALSLSGFLVAVMGLVSLYYQDWYNDFFRVQPLSIFGVYLIGDNHNSLAEFLVVASFSLLALKYWIKSERGRKLINVLFWFIVIITVGTFSRTAWIVLAFQLSLYFGYNYFIIQKKNLDMRRLLLILFMAAILLWPFAWRMTQLQAANTSSTANRLLLTQISWRAFLNHPLLGYGPGNFVNLVEDNIRFRAQYGDPLDSHGLGQKILAETGALGVLTFAGLILFIFYKLFQTLRRYPQQVVLLLPLIIAAAGDFIYQLFSTSYFKGRLWLPMALALIAAKLIENKYAEQKKLSQN